MNRVYVISPAISENATAQKPDKPVVRVDRNGEQEDCFGVQVDGPCRVVYSVRRTHDGAHVWIETESNVTAIPVVEVEA